MKTEIYLKLANVAPSIAFTATRELDPNFTWDGDGSDPQEDGFDPYDVTVTARAIVNGNMLEGSANLGGSYFQPDEPLEDVHGYLLQMLKEAAQELEDILPAGNTHGQCVAAQRLLKEEMQRAYDAQRAEVAAK